MDENETPEDAALRELEEETGYVGENIVDVSEILAADPGRPSAVDNMTAVSNSDFSRNDERDNETRLHCRHLQGPA